MELESQTSLLALHYFFQIFHVSLILFNLFGWAWKVARPWNLASLLLTGASWILLAPFFGFGYCPLTDWHYEVLRQLGHFDLPNSYIAYLVESITSIRPSATATDVATGSCYIASLLLSIYLNLRDRRTA
ncbi:MAG: DUF2784 family protein [Leptospiraceae bacterium]|nr:DUF2784 family protein [Leptospiraceae bacterium]